MSGTLSLDDAHALTARGELETVVCALPDLWGRLVGKRVRAESFFRTALGGEGLHASLYLFCVGMDMDPGEGYALTDWARGFPDGRLVPDLATLRLNPWMPRTAIVLCDMCFEDSDELVPMAPRSILKRQIALLHEMELSLKCATELEFFLFRDSFQEGWDKRYQGLTPGSRFRADYHVLQSTMDESFIGQIREYCSSAGVEVENSKPEWGRGQHEISLRYATALEMADRHVLYKTWVKELAAREGLSVTFMAKPFIDEVGSSCHLHASLWDRDGTQPLSWSADGNCNLSETMQRFVAGLLSTARQFMLCFAPNVNSYKRIQPESFAPTVVAIGRDNRTCSHRLVGSEASYRVENRIPGADANPYLAIAATIAGGLVGIKSGAMMPELCRDSAYRDSGRERLPATLGEAISAFCEGSVTRCALGVDVFDHLLQFFRIENDRFLRLSVTDWERLRYFERA